MEIDIVNEEHFLNWMMVAYIVWGLMGWNWKFKEVICSYDNVTSVTGLSSCGTRYQQQLWKLQPSRRLRRDWTTGAWMQSFKHQLLFTIFTRCKLQELGAYTVVEYFATHLPSQEYSGWFQTPVLIAVEHFIFSSTSPSSKRCPWLQSLDNVRGKSASRPCVDGFLFNEVLIGHLTAVCKRV